MPKKVNPIDDIAVAPIRAATEPEFASLDERVLKAYAQSATALRTDRQDVLQGIDLQPGKLSDPTHLFELQKRISDYGLQVSLISAVTRKGVTAVETLLRA